MEDKPVFFLPKQTTMTTLSSFNVHSTNVVESINEMGRKQQVTMFTIKGRLEFNKDKKAVLLAASRTPYITTLKTDDLSVEIGWELGLDGEVWDNLRDQVQDTVRQFVCHLVKIYKDNETEFPGQGVEPHVFIESLKPLDLYDGRRDGELRSLD